MLKVEFENIIFNEKTKIYRVLENNSCVYESKDKYEAIIYEATKMKGIDFRNIRVKREVVNGVELPQMIHYEKTQNRYILYFNNKYLYSNHNLDEVMKLYNYLMENGIENTIKYKWKIVEKQHPGRKSK